MTGLDILMAVQIVHKARRISQRRKRRAERSRQHRGIDITKFMIPILKRV
jgi:hypothetical protein